ncbi:MAG: hypothetical protein OQK78_05845 [Gammaproteobacteria bacterium]|nr:hypothetical protein [Gammaproteobacteria bacterium]
MLTCGSLKEVVKTTWDQLKGLFGIVALITIAIEIIGYIKGVDKVVGVFKTVVEFLGVSSLGGFVIWAIIVYLVSVYVIFRLWYDNCVADQAGGVRCITGVVEAVHGEDLGALLDSEHPHIELVSRSHYWPLIELNADHIFCSDAGSPMMKIYFKSSRICSIKGGATIGAAVAGAAGVVAAAAAAAAIGCATVIFCALALLVAALIVVAAAIAGAFAGAGIAAAATDEDSAEYDDGVGIQKGDYLNAKGPSAKNMNFKGAIVQYFNNEVTLLGRSPGTSFFSPFHESSFSHSDPDASIPNDMDICYPGEIPVVE